VGVAVAVGGGANWGGDIDIDRAGGVNTLAVVVQKSILVGKVVLNPGEQTLNVTLLPTGKLELAEIHILFKLVEFGSAESLENFEQLSNFSLPPKQWPTQQHLRHDATNAPHVHTR